MLLTATLESREQTPGLDVSPPLHTDGIVTRVCQNLRLSAIAGDRPACRIALLIPLSMHAALLAQVPNAGPPLSTAAIAKLALPAVVTITTSTGQGSGVIVDPNGLIVTSLHVIRGDNKVSVRLANGDIYDDLVVIEVDERRDLLLLRIKAVDLAHATIGNSDRVSVGDKVVLIGSPKGLDLTVSDGLISAVRDSGEGYRLFQTNAAASPGSSGGGMFNEAGHLVGILTAKVTTGENLNFGIPAHYVRGLMAAPRNRGTTLDEFVAAYPALATSSAEERSGTAAPATANTATIDLLTRLLNASGTKFAKNTDDSWVVSYRGERLAQVNVYISLYQDLVVLNSTVAKSPTIPTDQILAVLAKNFELNLAKVALDNDGDLVALTEVELRLLDGPALKRIIEAVAWGAEEAAGALKATGIPTAPALTFSSGPTFRALTLLQGRARVRYDPLQWIQEPQSETGVFQFKNASGDVYMRVITERIEIPIDRMPEIVLENAQSIDANAKITRRAWREVNGTRLLLLEIDATTKGIAITYYYHCASDPAGTIQLVGFTGRSLMEEYRPAIERFVAGFEITPR